MSDKAVDSGKKKTLTSILKWSAGLLAIAALETGGIVAAVKISESKNAEQVNHLQAIRHQLQAQENKINDLEKLPHAISANEQQIAANLGMLNLLSESLTTLKAEVGNKKIDLINQRMETLNHRMESVEETKNQEALILSLALIIKENALYNRSFSQETDILAELSQNQKNIISDINELKELKNINILTDTQLIEKFKLIAEDFSFEKAEVNDSSSSKEENRSAVSKSIELIKDTVAGINFDKVVVIKKDKKTNEQKLLLQTLSDLVNAQNFKDALLFIENNPQFNNADNQNFVIWQQEVKQKIMFDSAISHIIATQLNALRQDFAAETIAENK